MQAPPASEIGQGVEEVDKIFVLVLELTNPDQVSRGAAPHACRARASYAPRSWRVCADSLISTRARARSYPGARLLTTPSAVSSAARVGPPRALQAPRDVRRPRADPLALFWHDLGAAAGDRRDLSAALAAFADGAGVEPRVQCPRAAAVRRLAPRDADALPERAHPSLPLPIPQHRLEDTPLRVPEADLARRHRRARQGARRTRRAPRAAPSRPPPNPGGRRLVAHPPPPHRGAPPTRPPPHPRPPTTPHTPPRWTTRT